jgi:hypothetical protein
MMTLMGQTIGGAQLAVISHIASLVEILMDAMVDLIGRGLILVMAVQRFFQRALIRGYIVLNILGLNYLIFTVIIVRLPDCSKSFTMSAALIKLISILMERVLLA